MIAPPTSLFRAFADATRLRLLHLLLQEKELCVCDLCAVLGESQPKVSRHLAVLRRAGLVEARRDGKWVFYALAPETPLHRSLLRCIRTCLGGLGELERDRARLRTLALRLRCADEARP